MIMMNEQTAGQRIIARAKQALAFVQGEDNNCIVHIPDEVDTVRIRKKIDMKQSHFVVSFSTDGRGYNTEPGGHSNNAESQ